MKFDNKVKVVHQSICCFMKCPWNCISWNALKEMFHSVYFPAENQISISTSQLTFTCSKSTIETLEKGVKYIQS